jgi:uncharacterized SAM-binding protein YcdF (DUF218 family)
MKTAIVILGSPNDAQGNLSSIALERCAQGLAEYRRHPGARIIPTGGWGSHFNTTAQPHGYYTRKYLEAHGVPPEVILACAESANTPEDARLCRPIVERHGITALIVVTSDFHIPRARFLFEREYPKVSLRFVGAETHLPEAELASRKQHEERALTKLRPSP